MNKYITYILAFLLYCITFYVATQCRFPELDEIYFADAPANLLLNGEWKSHIVYSQFLYQPLYAFVLIPWMLIFGVSHYSVCGLGVLFGFVTCIALLQACKTLCLISHPWQEYLLIVGFWAVNTFTDFETFGRPDNLGMLITLLIIYTFLRYPNIASRNALLLGIMLILVGVYEVPVFIFFFSLMMIFSYNNRKELTCWLRKGVYFASGILVGELLVCVFFFLNRYTSLMSYIQYTFMSSMNANATSTNGVIDRMYETYTYNWYITFIFVLFIVLLIVKKISYNKIITFFIISLPGLMTLAGRFVPYYSWIYYIPLCVLMVYTLRNYKKAACTFISLLVLSSVSYFVSQWFTTYGFQEATIGELNEKKNKCSNYFEEKRNIISHFDNVVLSEEQLYYHVVNSGGEVWFQYRKNIDSKLEFYNYNDMNGYLDSKLKRKSDDYINKPYIGTFLYFYRYRNPRQPYFPEQGICIYTCEEEKTTSLAFLKHFGYNYNCLDDSGEFSIYQFNKIDI